MRDGPSASYQLTSPIDFRAALDLLGSDHLIVDATRMFIIFRNAVLDIKVKEGDLKTAELIAIEVLDSPPRSAEGGITLLERFLENLEATTGTDWIEGTPNN
ncbi:hypothetical protein [Natronococcus wangiae]|uniref:hypothetical protein n=1 Tax=Natronococcus wangiae TaxID=3068275 RepID=UPI00273D76EF|nr:hypothetical protein [Natronococcus sp. AD5]